MTWRPMIIDAESSGGIRAGHQTRASRLTNLSTVNQIPDAWRVHHCEERDGHWYGVFEQPDTGMGVFSAAPWRKGDLLWFREPLQCSPMGSCRYVADDGLAALHWPWRVKTLSGRYMPKWACRGWGRVSAEPVPRQVQEITHAETMSEGCPVSEWPASAQWWRDRWVGLHGVESWERNDWIWPIEFEVHDRAWAEAHGWQA